MNDIAYRTPASDKHLDLNESDICPFCKIEELEAQRKWQPIETAPMDGTFHVRGLWVHKHNVGYEWQQFVGYIDDDGDFVDDYGDLHTGWDTEDFSHWMPLPEPPKAIKGEGVNDS